MLQYKKRARVHLATVFTAVLSSCLKLKEQTVLLENNF